MKDVIKVQPQVRLSLLRDKRKHAVLINSDGWVQVGEEGAPGQTFSLLPGKHLSSADDIVYEIHSPSGKQIIVGDSDALQESSELIPPPVPAYRIIRTRSTSDVNSSYQVKLQALDNRFVEAYDDASISYWDEAQQKQKKRQQYKPGKQLRLLHDDFVEPDTFILEWLDPPVSGEQ
ncbi:hypothetical protein ACIQUF_10010 [Pseudomonas sp. NPDC090233]|uniref:hypothetical protein n=1 Tax=Pseudomonas sp. NPDC090233 TaxID=3364479 RepID=UPI003839D4FC